MEKIDKIFTWAKQIVLNINVTADNAVDLLFSPVYSLIDFLQATIYQWATNPLKEEETEQNNTQKRIGFNR